jgi:hypothetical protein
MKSLFHVYSIPEKRIPNEVLKYKRKERMNIVRPRKAHMGETGTGYESNA